MAQHAILRFEKHKGNPARPLEAHHERQKEQYASNPDIDTSRSKYNFHIVKRSGRYYHFIQSRIEQAGCRTRRDSTRFVDTLITASPEFFKKKSPKEMPAVQQPEVEEYEDRDERGDQDREDPLHRQVALRAFYRSRHSVSTLHASSLTARPVTCQSSRTQQLLQQSGLQVVCQSL